MNFPAPPLDQIPLAPGEFLMLDGFEIPSLARLALAHRDRVRACASYVDNFGGFPELVRELGGHGIVLASITIFGNRANIGDDETGALSDASEIRWLNDGNAEPIGGMPGIYKSVSGMDSIHGPRAWYWAAHFGRHGGGVAAAHICGPATCGLCRFEVHASQCYDVGPNGENVDVSICRPGFLGVGAAHPPPLPDGKEMMAITSHVNEAGHTEVFVEAQPSGAGHCGEVFHLWKEDKPTGPANWNLDAHGNPDWQSLGTPK